MRGWRGVLVGKTVQQLLSCARSVFHCCSHPLRGGCTVHSPHICTLRQIRILTGPDTSQGTCRTPLSLIATNSFYYDKDSIKVSLQLEKPHFPEAFYGGLIMRSYRKCKCFFIIYIFKRHPFTLNANYFSFYKKFSKLFMDCNN